MKNCAEMVSSLFERRAHYINEKKRKRKVIIRTLLTFFCIASAAFLGFGIKKIGILDSFPQLSESSSAQSENNNPSENQSFTVIWATDGSDTEDHCLVEWNGKQIEYSLLTALQNISENIKAAIIAQPYIDKQYVYNEKSLAEYETAANAERNLPDKLGQLIKLGDCLKYGEILYQTGAPNGEKWSKEAYDEKASFFGEELLSKYITNGEFLIEKAQSDFEAAFKTGEAQNSYELACLAYFSDMLKAAKKQLEAQGINHDIIIKSDHLIFYASEKEFAPLALDNTSNWYFTLADKYYEDSENKEENDY